MKLVNSMNYNDLIESSLSFLNFKKTLREASKDSHNNEYMTNCTMNVIDFDQYKDYYIKQLNLPKIYDYKDEEKTRNIKSNDVLFIYNDEIYFIEFKNGSINKTDTFKIHTKLYDSLLIILDILGENISFSKENIKYILVFNEEKKHNAKSFNSTDLQYITSRVGQLANDEIIQFDLHKFKDIYLNEVHTYTKSEFERMFVDKYKNIDMFVNACSGA